jgi:Zn-finger nucleic acid-binding protein
VATDLICPKCQGNMRTYERSGVTVDQCGECRGIFLDRGELERLVDAEQGWQGGHSAPRDRDRDDDRDRDRDYDSRRDYERRDYEQRGYSQSSQKKRKKSFFDELFD